MGPDSRLLLDRSLWDYKVIQGGVTFSPSGCAREELEAGLKDTIIKVFDSLSVDLSKWILPLSGGYDSRAILMMLKDRPGLKTVTWGRRVALEDKYSDAYIAGILARNYGIENIYLETDISSEPIEKIFKRFLVVGEGRVDHISGYIDGLAIWKHLYETGTQGILRGDEAFGCAAVRNNNQVYKNMGLMALSDYMGMDSIEAELGMAAQKKTEALERKHCEAIEIWRDRLNAQFEIPYLFAALNDIKLSYIEVVSPLLSRKIVEQVRRLPNGMRTGKAIFKKIVTKIEPNIEYAKRPAIEPRGDILRQDRAVDVIVNYLRTLTNDKEKILTNLSDHAIRLIDGDKGRDNQARSNIVGIARHIMQKFIKMTDMPPVMDPYCFAFRTYIIAQMGEVMRMDSEALRESKSIA